MKGLYHESFTSPISSRMESLRRGSPGYFYCSLHPPAIYLNLFVCLSVYSIWYFLIFSLDCSLFVYAQPSSRLPEKLLSFYLFCLWHQILRRYPDYSSDKNVCWREVYVTDNLNLAIFLSSKFKFETFYLKIFPMFSWWYVLLSLC
jgi:hypothetical protein